MDGDLLEYCVVGMPYKDFLDAFFPQTTVTRSAKAQAFCEARQDFHVAERPTHGKKRARPGDALYPKPTVYGRYVDLDDNRLNTGTFECQDIKLLSDIFEDIKAPINSSKTATRLSARF